MSSDDIHTPQQVRRPAHLKTAAAAVIALAVGIVVGGLSGRFQDDRAMAAATRANAVTNVLVIGVNGPREVKKLVLPGTLQAFFSASIYSRVSGYLKRWQVDIGDKVKAGQLMAEIETPDLDQQLEQAVADLATAKANEQLSEITASRWQALLKTDSVSRQESDEKSGDYKAKQTIVVAAAARVEQLKAMQSFRRITAPFDGIVTARKTDIGALINAGHDTGRDLFVVADVHKLRLYVSVPQVYANRLQANMSAGVEVPEHPGLQYAARLVGDSRSVSDATGAVLIQLEVDNSERSLLPGDYANVTLTLPSSGSAIQIPASALIFQKEGTLVAVVDADKRVHLRKVEIAHDFGNALEIASGLKGDERIVDNPPDTLIDGQQVQVKDAAAKPEPKPGAKP